MPISEEQSQVVRQYLAGFEKDARIPPVTIQTIGEGSVGKYCLVARVRSPNK